MKYEWVNVKKKLPPIDEIFKAKFKVDIPCYSIYVGSTKRIKLIFSVAAGGLVLKLNIESTYEGFGMLEDISHWLKIDDSIESRFDILDL